MPVYRQLGEIPAKRHKIFRRPSGELYAEELVGNMGFVGPSSLLYHARRPTAVRALKTIKEIRWESAGIEPLRHRHFRTKQLTEPADAIAGRTPLLFNSNVSLEIVRPSEPTSNFYRNAQGDEIVFVSEGEGVLESPFGSIIFRAGDYLVIPRGILHRYRFSSQNRILLVIESAGYVRTPKRYRNEYGQLTESSPYSERDMRGPQNLEVRDEKGEFKVIVKKAKTLTEMVLAYHPFDVVGWDGFYYPWAINIRDFEPRVAVSICPLPRIKLSMVMASSCARSARALMTSIPKL